MKRAWVFVALALLGLAGRAHAETPPSVWDRAKKPEVGDEYELHLTVRRIMDSQVDSDLPTMQLLNEAQNMRVLAMLQSAGAEKSTNPLLRYDLAEAYMNMKQWPRAVATFKDAMRDFPDHPQTRRSRFQLALACGHVGDHECEERLYRQVVAQSTSAAESSTPLLNLAETEMHNHDLKEAIEDYREAFRLCGFFQAGHRTPALILWGLAVALDRASEIREADETAQRALEMAQNQIEILRSEDVFFVPDYEVLWYEALTFAAAAKRASTPQKRLDYWLQAERRMSSWVTGAERTKDYWLPVAKVRLETYQKARKEAERAQVKHARDDGDVPLYVPPSQPPSQRPGPSGAGQPLVPPTPRPPKIKPPRPIPKTGDVHL